MSERRKPAKADGADVLLTSGLVCTVAGVAFLWGWPWAVLTLGVLSLALALAVELKGLRR